MGQSSRVLLAAGVCGTGLIVLVLLVRSGSPGTTSAQEVKFEGHSTSSPQAPAADPSAALEAPAIGPENAQDGRTKDSNPIGPAVDDTRTPIASAYAGLLSMPETTVEEMEVKKQALLDKLSTDSGPILMKRFETGQAEFVSDDREYKVKKQDALDIVAIRKEGEKGTYRAVLPRAEYPDLYQLRDNANRLDKMITDVQVKEFMAKRRSEEAGAPK